jgi:uncharacterized iron-regulated protein
MPIRPLVIAALAALMGGLTAVRADDAGIYRAGRPVTFDEMIADLARMDVILVGEQHDSEAGHAFEARLLQGLGQARPGLALSLEMFERDVQLVLDEYLAGYITESAFLAASRPWPRYKTDYRPLVEWAREARRPVIAANVPRRYVNMVSRGGQTSLLALPRASRALLPRLPYRMDLDPAYEAELDSLFGAPHGSTPAPGMPSAENMKQAQALWDHGMAESIVAAWRRSDVRAVLHVCGSMHCERGFGITARLKKAAPRLRVATVILRPTPPDGSALPAELGTYVVDCGPATPPQPPSPSR